MKVLLLTDIPPCRNFTAGLVLDRLVSFLTPEQIALCAVVNPSLNPEIPAELKSLPKLILKKPREASARIFPRKAGNLSAFAFELIQAARVRYELLPQIVAFAKQQQVDAIWVVLQGQTMVRIARPLSQELGLPLLTQVWDPFGWWLRANRIDSITQRRLLTEFNKVIQHSASCATASWAMSETYSNQYGVRNQPVIAGLPREIALEPATHPHASDEFIIGMAGQFYAQAEWSCLIQTLNQVSWKIAEKKIRIRVMGGGFQSFTQSPANFEYLGWQSQEETIRLLSESDLLYMPYWFSEEFREESSSSFPSKLVTYFAAGRPVFCHAPAYASPAKYIKQHDAGYLCESLDPPAVLKHLEQAITDTEHYRKMASNGNACFMQDFTLERMKETFLQFLNIQVITQAGIVN